MGKKATTIDEQIALLRKRGMNLDLPEAKVKEILMDIGYYRLGFYWHSFEIDKKHNFKHDALFSNAVALYYLDFNLRSLFTKYLNRIEINFRSKVIYEVCNHYKNNPVWFADNSIMKKQFVEELPIVYNYKFKINNTVIKNHHLKYINDKYAPAWKTLEFLPFGSILRLYQNIKSNEVKKKVSLHYDLRNYHHLESHMRSIILLRKLCAHGGQLYDMRFPKGIASTYKLKLTGEERTNLNGGSKLVEFYLSKISVNRSVEFRIFFEDLIKNESTNPILNHIIETKVGLKFVKDS